MILGHTILHVYISLLTLAIKGPVFLFFSVNGSGHFCGMAQMLNGVDYHSSAGVWAQDKWKGILVSLLLKEQFRRLVLNHPPLNYLKTKFEQLPGKNISFR